MPAKQPTPQSSVPQIHVGRISVIIAIILFFVGLVLYLTSSPEQQPEFASRQNISQNAPVNKQSESDPRPQRVEGQIIIKFNDGVTDQQITERIRPLNASIKSKVSGIGATVLNVPPGQEDAILAELANDPLVKYAEPDYVYYLEFTPNDPLFNQQWGLVNTGQAVNNRPGTADVDIDIEEAWDVSKGTGVKVAILDSGVDASHPDLASKIVGSQSFSTQGTNDVNGHGTHVAGIVAANVNNGQGVAGVCPDCQLLIGKITTDDIQGSVPASGIAPSVTWAADNGAQVINMSIAGKNFSQAVQDAVNYAWGKNAVIIGAAGNEGGNERRYPAAYANVVSVANINSTNQRSSTSNFGDWVHLAAPGDMILSTVPTGQNLRNITDDYAPMSGTSMASPAVAGVAALVWKSQYGINNASVVKRLFDTAEKIPGTGANWVYGRVNASAAVGTPPVSGTPSPSSIMPTFVCAGSNNSICTPSTTVPSSSVPGTSTAPGQPVPSGTVVMPPTPCGTGQASVATYGKKSKHKKTKKGGVNNSVDGFLKLLIQLINLILLLLGGGQVPVPDKLNNPNLPCPPSGGLSPYPTETLSLPAP